MNDLDLRLEVVSSSRQPLRYIWRWISRKPLEIEAWRLGSKGPQIGNGIWSRDRWRLVKLLTPIRLECNISKTAGDRDSVPEDHNRKWHMKYQMVRWPMTPRDPKGAPMQYGRLSQRQLGFLSTWCSSAVNSLCFYLCVCDGDITRLVNFLMRQCDKLQKMQENWSSEKYT